MAIVRNDSYHFKTLIDANKQSRVDKKHLAVSLFNWAKLQAKMVAEVKKIFGYEEFVASIESLAKSAENVNVLFTGKKDDAGRSWCPDCNDGKVYADSLSPVFNNIIEKKTKPYTSCPYAADPYVKKYCIDQAAPNSLFVVVDVGDRPT